jgi:hypothetical protein
MSDEATELPRTSEAEFARLIPVEERQVNFYGDEITAALVKIGEQNSLVYVPIRPICNYLGLDWSSQRKRLNRDEILKESQGVVIMTTPGGVQEMLCLPLELLPGWLFGVETNRVKPELKEKIIRYRRECFKVLWQAFQTDAINLAEAGIVGVELADLDTLEAERARQRVEEGPSVGELALMQLREMGLSIARMAEQQLELERETKRAHDRLDSAREFLQGMQFRLTGIDRRLHSVEDRVTPPDDYITEEQISQLQLEVKALAQLLTSRDSVDKRKNHYQGIFNELYRRFGVSSYAHIRLGQYANVMQFLADWKHAADNNISNEVFLQGKLF